MRAVLQRVTSASVHVAEERVAQIGTGLLALVGVTHDDDLPRAVALADKIATLRILRGERNVVDTGAEILVVSQFTLYADTRKGRRPSWNAAAPGPVAGPLVDAVSGRLRELGARVATGVFGSDMRVELINDGPVTLIIDA